LKRLTLREVTRKTSRADRAHLRLQAYLAAVGLDPSHQRLVLLVASVATYTALSSYSISANIPLTQGQHQADCA
jgi:hypothetical protein